MSRTTMPEHVFRFKQFSVQQKISAHKIGMDALVLGSFAQVAESMNILDIGTGTGVLALMMAQKSDAIIDAVEIDPDSAREASQNFEASPWSYRLHCYAMPLQAFIADDSLHYDTIICNPPYFDAINPNKGNNKQMPETARQNARLNNTLLQNDLLDAVAQLLVSYGVFYTIFPANQLLTWLEKTEQRGLFVSNILKISSFENTEPIRIAAAFGKQITKMHEESFFIYNTDKSWSNDYKQRTASYHIQL